MKKFLCCAFFFVLWVHAWSQSHSIDSLKSALKLETTDSGRVNILLKMAKDYLSVSTEDAVSCLEQARKLSEQANLPEKRAFAYLMLGNVYYQEAKSLEAIQAYDSAIVFYTKQNNKVKLSNVLNNKGAVYFNQSEDDKALEFYLASLKYAEEAKDKRRILTALTNIGAVYTNQLNTHELALQYLHKSLPLAYELKDNSAIGITCLNIGTIYFSENKDSLALWYFSESRKVLKGTVDESNALKSLGRIYLRRGEIKKALMYQQEAYNISEKLNARLIMVQSRMGIADVYFQTKNYLQAMENYRKAEIIAYEMQAGYELSDIYARISDCYKQIGDYKNSLLYHEKLIEMKDSLYNWDITKKIQDLQFKFDLEKKEGEIKFLTTDNALNHEIIRRNQTIRNVLIGGFFVVLIVSFLLYRQRNRIKVEKEKSEELLLNILPAEISNELKERGQTTAKHFDEVTVMFTDFVSFTKIAETLSPQFLVQELHECFSAFDAIVERHGLEKIKTVGDAYMAVCGLPVLNKSHAENCLKAALDIIQFMEERKQNGKVFDIRIGIHTGPVVAGIVGVKKFAYDIWGDTVNTASRMESSGEAGKINISESTYTLVKDHFSCTPRGKISAKGKGMIDMYFVEHMLEEKRIS